MNDPGAQARAERRRQRELGERMEFHGAEWSAHEDFETPGTGGRFVWNLAQFVFILVCLGVAVYAIATVLAP